MKGASHAAGLCRRTFEDVFQIMTVVLIETTQLDWLVASLQLTLHRVVFSTAVHLQRQTAVRPKLFLVRNRRGVWISAISRAARIGPIYGIWQSRFVAACLRLSAKRSCRAS